MTAFFDPGVLALPQHPPLLPACDNGRGGPRRADGRLLPAALLHRRAAPRCRGLADQPPPPASVAAPRPRGSPGGRHRLGLSAPVGAGPTMSMPDDEEIDGFYSLRDQLHSRVSSSLGVPPPTSARPAGVPLMQPQNVVTGNTVRLAAKPGKMSRSEVSEDSLSADFDSLHASLTSKLRNAAWEGIRAAEQRVVGAGSAAPPTARRPAWASMPAPATGTRTRKPSMSRQLPRISAAAAARRRRRPRAVGGGGIGEQAANVVRTTPSVRAPSVGRRCSRRWTHRAPWPRARRRRARAPPPAASRAARRACRPRAFSPSAVRPTPSEPTLDAEMAPMPREYATTTDVSTEVMFGHL